MGNVRNVNLEKLVENKIADMYTRLRSVEDNLADKGLVYRFADKCHVVRLRTSSGETMVDEFETLAELEDFVEEICTRENLRKEAFLRKVLERNRKDENTPVYEWEDATNFIAERCDIDKETIEKVLLLEEDYMRTIGVIVDEEDRISDQEV